jgi:hypothetical protein
MNEFFQSLHHEVMQKCNSQDPLVQEEAFTEWVLEMLSEDTVFAWDPCYHRTEHHGRDRASGINAWALSGDGTRLDLFISSYAAQKQEFSKPDIERQFGLAMGFYLRAKKGFHADGMSVDDVAYAPMRAVFESQQNITKIRIFFLTNGVAKFKNLDLQTLNGLVEYQIWDLQKIADHKPSKKEAVKLDFENEYGGPVPCIYVADAMGEYRTFLAFFPAEMLVRIYNKYAHRLLEQNVRVFLQATGTVNKGLQKTLAEQPSRFLAYNNGLCCTASAVMLTDDGSGHAFLRSITDFQIVNGGQTSSSLHFFAQKGNVDNLKKVRVQVKISVIEDPEKVDEMVPLISRYANSQNKVSGADFSANGPFHRELQKISQEIAAPAQSGISRQTYWYYERAKGAYLDEKARHVKKSGSGRPGKAKSEWEERHPARQKLTKTDVAKFEHCWAGNPHFTCLGADKSFKKLAEQHEVREPVVDPVYFKHLVAKAIIWNTIEDQFDSLNLKGVRSQVVAFVMAFLAIRSDKRIDLEWIWTHQRCQAGLLEFVLKLCRRFHEVISTDEGVPGFPGAGAQLSKTERYWKKFLELMIDVVIPEDWRSEWSRIPYEIVFKTEDALALEWERVRNAFVQDPRTMGALAAAVQKPWINSKNNDLVRVWAAKSWIEIERLNGFGAQGRKKLVELFSAAAGSLNA